MILSGESELIFWRWHVPSECHFGLCIVRSQKIKLFLLAPGSNLATNPITLIFKIPNSQTVKVSVL
jgi:hypothetical protein